MIPPTLYVRHDPMQMIAEIATTVPSRVQNAGVSNFRFGSDTHTPPLSIRGYQMIRLQQNICGSSQLFHCDLRVSPSLCALKTGF